MHLLSKCSCGASVEVPLQTEVGGACTPVALGRCGRQQTNVAASVVATRIGHLQLEKTSRSLKRLNGTSMFCILPKLCFELNFISIIVSFCCYIFWPSVLLQDNKNSPQEVVCGRSWCQMVILATYQWWVSVCCSCLSHTCTPSKE